MKKNILYTCLSGVCMGVVWYALTSCAMLNFMYMPGVWSSIVDLVIFAVSIAATSLLLCWRRFNVPLMIVRLFVAIVCYALSIPAFSGVFRKIQTAISIDISSGVENASGMSMLAVILICFATSVSTIATVAICKAEKNVKPAKPLYNCLMGAAAGFVACILAFGASFTSLCESFLIGGIIGIGLSVVICVTVMFFMCRRCPSFPFIIVRFLITVGCFAICASVFSGVADRIETLLPDSEAVKAINLSFMAQSFIIIVASVGTVVTYGFCRCFQKAKLKKGNIVNGAPDVEVVFEFNGTRKTPAADGYRPDHLIKEDYLTCGIHHYYQADSVAPDGTAKGTITFLSSEAYPHCLWIGKIINIQEGARVVGYATVTKILNPLLCREGES